MILLTTLALTSLGTSYYIYFYHQDHLKNLIIHKGLESYARLKIGYQDSLKYLAEQKLIGSQNQTTQFKIISLLLLDPINQTITPIEIPEAVSSPEEFLSYLKLSKFHNLLHLTYQYQDNLFRIILGQSDPKDILTTNLNWLEMGFQNGIEKIHPINLSTPKLTETIHQYAGPLLDFYQNELEIPLRPEGMLNHDQTEFLFNQDSQRIVIEDILGEEIILSLQSGKN